MPKLALFLLVPLAPASVLRIMEAVQPGPEGLRICVHSASALVAVGLLARMAMRKG